MPTPQPYRTALHSLTHPASWAAMLLLFANDHLMKDLAPGVVSGKLSDVAGLFFFPALFALLVVVPVALAIDFIARAISRRKHTRDADAPRVFLVPARHMPTSRGSLPRGTSPDLSPTNPQMTQGIGAASFIVTAITFVAMKVDAGINAHLASIASRLLDTPVSFAPDPTDVLGVLAMIPAWILWQRCARREHEPLERRTAAPAIVVAALVTMATPAIRYEPGVDDLRIVDGTVLATIGSLDAMFATTDNGRTWRKVNADSIGAASGDPQWVRLTTIRKMLDSLKLRRFAHHSLASTIDSSSDAAARELAAHRDSVDSIVAHERILRSEMQLLTDAVGPSSAVNADGVSIVVADPRASRVLYRAVVGSTLIERSEDAGATWSVEWEIPVGRYVYMRRLLHRGSHRRGFGIADMLAAPDASGEIIVALGGEGVLVRDRDGEWSQHAIAGIEPVTASARSVGDVVATIAFELCATVALAAIAVIALGAAAWRHVPGTEGDERPRHGRRALVLATIVIPAFVVSAMSAPILGPLAAIVLALPMLIVYPLMAASDWSSIRRHAASEAALSDVVGTACRATIAAIVLPPSTMILWAYGVIVHYESAIAIALAAWLGAIGYGLLGMRGATKATGTSTRG